MQGACHMNFKATSPDGLVECACHGKGCSEIKCTWSHCDKTVQEAAEAPETCLTVTSDKSLRLKNSHTSLRYNFTQKLQAHATVIFLLHFQ